jgi:hypothetical protein
MRVVPPDFSPWTTTSNLRRLIFWRIASSGKAKIEVVVHPEKSERTTTTELVLPEAPPPFCNSAIL